MAAVEWFLVACAAHARLLQRERGLPMVQIAAFVHPEARLKSGELGDDRAGRERADRGFGATAYEPRSDAHRKEQQRFAHELAERLEEGARSNAYGSLVGVNSAVEFLIPLETAFFVDSEGNRPSVRMIENLIARDRSLHGRRSP